MNGRGVLLVDGGDLLLPDEPLSEDEIAQRQLKAELILDANLRMGIDAAEIGDQDLKLGVEWLHDLAEKKHFPFVCANLVKVADGKPVFPAHMVKTVAGLKVGIFGVVTPVDSDGKATVPPPTYRVDDPAETAKKEIAALKAEGAQVIVALSHLGLQEDHQLARDAQGIDFILGAHSQSLVAEPQKEGGTWIFQAGFRAKTLGRVDIDFKSALPGALAKLADVTNVPRIQERIKTYDERIAELTERIPNEPDKDRKQILQDQIDFYTEQKGIEQKNLPAQDSSASEMKNQLVDLSRDIVDEPDVEAMVKTALDQMSKMPAMPMNEDAGKADELPAGPASGPFVGAKVCQGCHLPEYQQWATTDHAKATRTLVADQHQFDFDCVGCHSTGYKQEGGPKDPFSLGGLVNVQCEVCHGPGRAHATDPKTVKLNTTVDEKFCRTCHSIEQTGDRFVFADYLAKVTHKKPATPGDAEKPGKGKTPKKSGKSASNDGARPKATASAKSK